MRTLHVAHRTIPRHVLTLFVSVAGACAAALAPTAACMALSLISDGSYIVEYYNDGVNPSAISATSSNIISYTNGLTSQSNVVIDPFNGNIQAYAAATVSGSLAVSIQGSGTVANPSTTVAMAETWDTLTFSNYPTQGSVAENTVLGTLTLTVNQTVNTTANATSTSAIGLSVFYTPSFLPALTGNDCGVVSLPCNGLIPASALGGANPATNGGTIGLNGGGSSAPGVITNPTAARPNPLTFSIPLTLGDLYFASGKISYIAEIATSLVTPDSGVSSAVIDPSITLTGLYPGVSVTGVTGSNYAPVPLPAAAWLFGSGLLGLLAVARRRQGRAAA